MLTRGLKGIWLAWYDHIVEAEMNTHDNNEPKPQFTEILVYIVIQRLSLILLLILQYIIVEFT